MQLNTAVSTIGLNAWTRVRCPALQPYRSSCVNVSDQKINRKGFFNANLSYKGNCTKGPGIVLNCPNIALISAQVIDELKLVKYDQGVIDK
jgi:predicted ATP-grasp superfamily ATP-dependent carboligase